MQPKYEYGQEVRVIRTLRDDGTYPGKQRGDLLVTRGSCGFVVDVGTFLQDQIIYRVHFLDAGLQVGCREAELIPSESPWVDSRFEFGQWIRANRDLAINGEPVVRRGDPGQILKVLREPGRPVAYQACFDGRTLQLREGVLEEQVEEMT